MADLFFGAVFVAIFFFMGATVSGGYTDMREKDDCEKALILRAHECKPYYLTTEEIKLIDRLGK